MYTLSPNVASKINYYPVPGSTGRIVQLILQNRTRIQAVHVCILHAVWRVGCSCPDLCNFSGRLGVEFGQEINLLFWNEHLSIMDPYDI